MSFSHFLVEDQRLVLLRLLHEMPGYQSNSSVLVSGLAHYGHSVSRDQIRSQLAWLEEQGLVTCQQLETVTVATLTERGSDVATGRARQPGVKRPGA